MSANQISKNDVIAYICTVLNIDITDKLLMMDMLDDLAKIRDLVVFKNFIKAEFMEEQYRYLNGYQKFLALTNTFQKVNFELIAFQVEDKANLLIEKVIRAINAFEKAVWKDGKNTRDYLNSFTFANCRQENGCMFDEKELNAIALIGDFKYWFTVSIEDDIYKLKSKLENSMRTSRINYISNDKKVMARLTRGVA